MAATRGKRKRSKPPMKKAEPQPIEWESKTKLGKLVKSGQITKMSEALNSGLPIREPEIVDVLLPDISDEVIDVNMVQRMTDSGRRVKFVISVAVGNNDGYVGFGQAKGKEVGSSIRKAIQNAKLNMIEIRRGCGSWECGCKKPHTVPYAIKGKSGSVEITLKPAPQGIGLATGNVAKKILTLAGVQDCWAFTEGKTKTTVNYAKAVFNALEQNIEMRIMKDEINKIGILSGNIGTVKDNSQDNIESGAIKKEETIEEKPKEQVKPPENKVEKDEDKPDETEPKKEEKEIKEKPEDESVKPNKTEEKVEEKIQEEQNQDQSKEETNKEEQNEEKTEDKPKKEDK